MSTTQAEVGYKFVGRPSNRPSDEELIKLYKEHPVREIAEMFGVKRSTVSAWMTQIRKAGQLDEQTHSCSGQD